MVFTRVPTMFADVAKSSDQPSGRLPPGHGYRNRSRRGTPEGRHQARSWLDVYVLTKVFSSCVLMETLDRWNED